MAVTKRSRPSGGRELPSGLPVKLGTVTLLYEAWNQLHQRGDLEQGIVYTFWCP